MKDPELLNMFGRKRLSNRHIDELVGISRGLIADGQINQAEVEFLQKWLAATLPVSEHPILNLLYRRVADILADGVVDEDEKTDLFQTLDAFATQDFELGEEMKSSRLPLCEPAPVIAFPDMRYCFTGTFTYGSRSLCEGAVTERGGFAGSLTQKTNVLVVGIYATESWKHSNMGDKIARAVEWRDRGIPISIVSEDHWRGHL